jgi:tRNA(fMet)-specific endonuclease VapC
MWLLDTNVWILYLAATPNPLQARIASQNPEDLYLCDIVKAELLYGAFKSQRVTANLAKLDTLFGVLPSLPFDGDAAYHFGEIRAHLTRQGPPIGPYDMQIAAIARSRQLIRVTHNQREFSRISGLRLEDWQT